MKLNQLRKRANEKGFTLIELMIVVAIIGILAAIAIPNFLGMQEKAKRKAIEEAGTSAKAELHSWMDSYIKDEKGVVDVNKDGVVTSVDDPGGAAAAGDLSVMVSTYIASFYKQKGTKYSPWYGTKLLFTSVNTPSSGILIFSMDTVTQRIVLRGYDKNKVEIWTDSVTLE